MAEGFEVSPEAMINCGNEISNLGKSADQLKSMLDSAEVPDIAWGLLGAATTFSSYQDLLEKLKEHIYKVGEGVAKAGLTISDCGRDYQDQDKQTAEKLQKILDELGQVKA